MRKLLFLLLFIPAHAVLTLFVLQPSFNPPPGLAATAWHAARIVLTLPLVLPLMHFDPDGDRLPRWLQWLSLVLNSAIWAAAIAGVWTAVEWAWARLAARDDRRGD